MNRLFWHIRILNRYWIVSTASTSYICGTVGVSQQSTNSNQLLINHFVMQLLLSVLHERTKWPLMQYDTSCLHNPWHTMFFFDIVGIFISCCPSQKPSVLKFGCFNILEIINKTVIQIHLPDKFNIHPFIPVDHTARACN